MRYPAADCQLLGSILIQIYFQSQLALSQLATHVLESPTSVAYFRPLVIHVTTFSTDEIFLSALYLNDGLIGPSANILQQVVIWVFKLHYLY